VKRRPAGTSLGEAVGQALAPVVKQHGFATAELVARWPVLVGERFARVTRPLRVVWPRQAPEIVVATGRAPATLVVACEGAHALDLQHAAPIILERVNALYGWRAIERLTIRQGPVRTAEGRVRRDAPPPPPESLARRVAAVEDAALRDALDRLAREIAARSPSRRRDRPPKTS
jgi:hypothetical protein